MSSDQQSGWFVHEGALRDLIRGAALKRLLSSISKKCEIEICEIPNKDDFIYGQWMSVILLSGPALQVTLKAHYFNNVASKIVALGLGKSSDQVTKKMVMDFMREFLNLTCGEIKSILADCKISVGLSLPLITRGFDEVLFSDVVIEKSLRDWWALRGEYGEVYCSAEIEIFQPDIFANLTGGNIKSKTEEEEGDVDFL